MYDLVTNLGPENYEILVAVGTDGNGLFTKMLEARRIKTRIIKNLRRSIRPGYDFKAIKEVRNLITEFIPDILFLNSPKAGVIGSLAARKFPLVKVIYRNGGWAFNDPAPWLVRWLYIGIEKFTANYKDHIIVNNQKEFEDAKRLKIKPRISLEKIYNGIGRNSVRRLIELSGDFDTARKGGLELLPVQDVIAVTQKRARAEYKREVESTGWYDRLVGNLPEV